MTTKSYHGFSNTCGSVQFDEAPLAAPVGMQVAKTVGKTAMRLAADMVPGLGALSTLIGAARDIKTAISDHERINTILKAISVNDSRRVGAWAKLDIDDGLYAMLSDNARRAIALRILNRLQAMTDVSQIPDGLGNFEAKAYVMQKLRSVR